MIVEPHPRLGYYLASLFIELALGNPAWHGSSFEPQLLLKASPQRDVPLPTSAELFNEIAPRGIRRLVYMRNAKYTDKAKPSHSKLKYNK